MVIFKTAIRVLVKILNGYPGSFFKTLTAISIILTVSGLNHSTGERSVNFCQDQSLLITGFSFKALFTFKIRSFRHMQQLHIHPRY